MHQLPPPGALSLIVLCSDTVEQQIRTRCHANDHLRFYQLDLLLDEQPACLDQLEDADALLVEWDSLFAPYYASLSNLARWHAVPLIALCATPEEDTLALMSGVDCTMRLPLSRRLLYASLHAYRHLVETVCLNERVRLEAEHLDEGPQGYALSGSEVLYLDERAQQFLVYGRPLDLSAREFELLRFLASQSGKMLTRDYLLREVWGLEGEGIQTNVVDVYIYYLRQKLTAHGVPDPIETVRGRGYRFHSPHEAPVATSVSALDTRACA